MTLPGRQEFVFSAKVFAAALLALFIAFATGMQRPAWSMLTVYIVASPYAGMVQSKALYRVAGTIVGGAVAVAAVTAFIGAPPLLCLVLAGWVGACVYAAMVIRPPRNYATLLAGYTAALVGFPSVDAPQLVFDTALARSEEIILGITCLALVNLLVLPRRVGPLLLRRIDDSLSAAQAWTRDVLAGEAGSARGAADHQRFLADLAALDALRVHAAYDTPGLAAAEGNVRRLQQRLHSLFALLVAIEDRVDALRRRPGGLDGLDPLLRRIARHRDGDGADSPDDLRAEIDRCRPGPAALRQDWHTLLRATLLARLHDLVDAWEACDRLRAAIAAGSRPDTRHPPVALHRDHLTAALAGLSATLGTLLCAAFWIATGWPGGAIATMMVAVGCSLFAATDNPAAVARGFTRMSAIASLVGAAYAVVILPAATGFEMLALLLAPYFLLAGAALAVPSLWGSALPLLVTTVAVLDPQNQQVVDFAGLANGAIAQIAGISLAVAVLALARPLGVPWAVHRLAVTVNRDLARLAAGDPGLSRHSFETRMVDRLHNLALRAAAGPDGHQTLDDALAALRVGLNLLELRRLFGRLPRPAALSLDGALRALARAFRARTAGRDGPDPFPALDKALSTLAAQPATAEADRALLLLAGLRHALALHGGASAEGAAMPVPYPLGAPA